MRGSKRSKYERKTEALFVAVHTVSRSVKVTHLVAVGAIERRYFLGQCCRKRQEDLRHCGL